MKGTKGTVITALVLGLFMGIMAMGLPHLIGNAQAGTSMGNQNTLLATGRIMGNQDALYLYTTNKKGEPMLMTYFVKGNQGLHLLSARNLKFDMKLKDKTFVGGTSKQHKPTSPPVQWIKNNLKKEEGNKD